MSSVFLLMGLNNVNSTYISLIISGLLAILRAFSLGNSYFAIPCGKNHAISLKNSLIIKEIYVELTLNSFSVPSYTQISRRAKTLNRQINRLIKKGVKELVFDSSGLKVCGEGAWKVRTHGREERRTWRKLDIGIDPDSQEGVVYELTSNAVGDAVVAKRLLESVDELERVYGDGGYDGSAFRIKALTSGALPFSGIMQQGPSVHCNHMKY